MKPPTEHEIAAEEDEAEEEEEEEEEAEEEAAMGASLPALPRSRELGPGGRGRRGRRSGRSSGYGGRKHASSLSLARSLFLSLCRLLCVPGYGDGSFESSTQYTRGGKARASKRKAMAMEKRTVMW
jgi:hypothetical protein